MPRKITTEEWKNRRDFNAWKIELDGYNMTDTHAKYDEAVTVLAEREEKRIGALKDTLWEAAAPFFGVNITPEDLKKYFIQIMKDDRNAGIVRKLKSLEEQRVKDLEAEDNARLAELRESHSTLVEKLDKAKKKANEKSEDSPVSDSDTVLEETSERESKADKYMTDSKEFDNISDDTISEDSET